MILKFAALFIPVFPFVFKVLQAVRMFRRQRRTEGFFTDFCPMERSR